MISNILKNSAFKTILTGSLLAILIFTFQVSTAKASIFDFINSSSCDYGCGDTSYSNPCDYGCGDTSYSNPCDYGCGEPMYSNPCDYGCGGYQQPIYSNPCDYGCGGYQQPSYQYTQYPYQIYQPVYQAPIQNSGYNYVQYPYPIYHYFQNPSPKASNDVWSTPISSTNSYGSYPTTNYQNTNGGFIRGY